ncbi:MAG: hypothetical protein P8X57_16335, partial [Cyclobacteriaceae bacterium]
PEFKRWSLKRKEMYPRISEMIARISPDLLIVNTHELLSLAVELKQKRPEDLKLIYDIRENYYDNLVLAGFPFSAWAARNVRKKEDRLATHIDHFILAEKCYRNLPFIDKRFTVLENKSVYQVQGKRDHRKLKKLVFTGTLSEQSGVFRAIHIAESLHGKDPNVMLKVVGNSFDRKIIRRIRSIASALPWMNADIAEAPLPYHRILEAIKSADAGMILNSNIPEIREKMPTKLYEYTAHQLPIICTDDSPWMTFMEQYPAAIPWQNDPTAFLKAFDRINFYRTKPGSEVLWKEL